MGRRVVYDHHVLQYSVKHQAAFSSKMPRKYLNLKLTLRNAIVSCWIFDSTVIIESLNP